jgi:hypothetical protein
MNISPIYSKKRHLRKIQTLLKEDPTLANLLTHDVDDLDEQDVESPGMNYSHLTDRQLRFIGHVSMITDLPITEFGLDPSHHRIQDVLGSIKQATIEEPHQLTREGDSKMSIDFSDEDTLPESRTQKGHAP